MGRFRVVADRLLSARAARLVRWGNGRCWSRDGDLARACHSSATTKVRNQVRPFGRVAERGPIQLLVFQGEQVPLGVAATLGRVPLLKGYRGWLVRDWLRRFVP